MVINRGEVWWASLPEPTGSGPGYDRPVVIIQADSFNQSAIRTVIVAIVTSNLSRANAPGNVLVSASASGLPRDSVINVTQMLAIDRKTLSEKIGELPSKTLNKVNDGLRLVLSL